jgi:hypothetical protein
MVSRSALGSNRLFLDIVRQTDLTCKLREHDQVPESTDPTFGLQIPRLVPPLNLFISSHLDQLICLVCSPSCRSTHTMNCTDCSVPKLMKYARTPISWANLTKFIQVYLNGSGHQHQSPYQSEAMENVYYWYDGNVPYCTDATAWQPLDDNFVHMNVPGYSYVDNSHGAVATHQVNGITCTRVSGTPWADFVPGETQLTNVRHGHYGSEESRHSYAPQQYWEPPYLSAHNRAHLFSSTPASPCTSIASHCTSPHSSLSWSDSVRSSPTQHHSNRQQQHSSDDLLGGLELLSAGATCPYPPHSVPSMASPVPSQAEQWQHQYQQQPPFEVRAPTPPPPPVPTSPVPDSTPPDLVGRRAPKRRRIARAVQPLACYFCRGRKIACGPPTSSRSGDRTCEYVVNSFL